jgi:hypothetical protein
MDGGSRRWRLEHLPAWLIDAGLAVALAVAITVAISVGADQGAPPDALAYGLGLTIAALSLLRRRWPLLALLASAATLFSYNQFDYPGLFASVPLSVTLATAWAAGHRGWALAVVLWFGGGPLVFVAVSDLPEETATQLLNGAVSDLALLAASTASWWPSRTAPSDSCSTSSRHRSPTGSSRTRP